MALALLLAPFFSFADGDIFQNGSIDLQAPDTETIDLYNCSNYADTGTTHSQVEYSDCVAVLEAGFEARLAVLERASRRNYSGSIVIDDIYASFNYTFDIWSCNLDGCEFSRSATGQLAGSHISFFQKIDSYRCPPANGFPSYTSSYTREDGSIMCYDPAQANLQDSCNDGKNEYLQNRVTVRQGCFDKPDGSSCRYNAVDVGGGVEAYQLDSEGDCYTDKLPEIAETGQQLPEDQTCSQWGESDMICNENPEDVCSESGNSCQQGCGTMNGETFCFSSDTDGDDIPDYLDPDIDGDGIKNEDDLDADGDGKDDPIDNTGSEGTANSGSGNATAVVNVDMGPTVAELKKINKTLSETEVVRQTEPSPDLVGFYESEYEDGIEGMFEGKIDEFKGTEFYTFLDQFKPSFGGSPPEMGFCMNFGTYMNLGCFEFKMDPRIWPALKIFILVTAGFTCRKILFGG